MAEPAPSPWMTTKACAVYLGVSVKCLDLWRSTGHGPPYSKPYGTRTLRYHLGKVEAWMHAAERLHTADDGQGEGMLREAKRLARRFG